MADVKSSLERVQNFDPETLARAADLGAALSFADAVEPARRIIALFSQFPIQYLDELASNQQNILKGQADSFFNQLQAILKFDPKTDNAYNQRTSLIEGLKNQFQGYFDTLMPIIAYGSSRLRDFSSLEREARAAVQAIMDRGEALTKQLEESKASAESTLTEVRRLAAEHGVSQQAQYFSSETSAHEKDAETWKWNTIYIAIGLGVYATLSALIHKIPFLTPTSTYETFQLGLSKFLIFAVLAYMLILFAKNFLAHKHNAIVNKHRQNALLTFNALVDAAKSEERRDIVLTYAAACIFGPQETGYARGTGSSPELPSSIIQALPKLAGGTGSSP